VKTLQKKFDEIVALQAKSRRKDQKVEEARCAAEQAREAVLEVVGGLILSTARSCDLHLLAPDVLVTGLRYIAIHGHDPEKVKEWILNDAEDQVVDSRPVDRSPKQRMRAEIPPPEGMVRIEVKISANTSDQNKSVLEAAGLVWNGKRTVWWGNVSYDQVGLLEERFAGRLKVLDADRSGSWPGNNNDVSAVGLEGLPADLAPGPDSRTIHSGSDLTEEKARSDQRREGADTTEEPVGDEALLGSPSLVLEGSQISELREPTDKAEAGGWVEESVTAVLSSSENESGDPPRSSEVAGDERTERDQAIVDADIEPYPGGDLGMKQETERGFSSLLGPDAGGQPTRRPNSMPYRPSVTSTKLPETSDT
jgi:hypothetical protein